jgi:hypothetical protein
MEGVRLASNVLRLFIELFGFRNQTGLHGLQVKVVATCT